jgi:hypothetical protein
MNRFFRLLCDFTSISALPAQVMTYSVVGIWVGGALGFTPAAHWWHENAGATTVFCQLNLAVWLAYKAHGRVTDAKARKEGVPQ